MPGFTVHLKGEKHSACLVCERQFTTHTGSGRMGVIILLYSITVLANMQVYGVCFSYMFVCGGTCVCVCVLALLHII